MSNNAMEQEISIEPSSISVSAESGTPPVKSTPKKRGQNKADNETPAKKAKGTPNSAMKIPKSVEEMSGADKMLLKMKEDGKGWPEINETWETMTGNKPTGASLRARYARLKTSLARIDDGDIQTMMKTIETVKEEIENEKKELEKKMWSKISDAMVAAGAKKYAPALIEKEAKRVGGVASGGQNGDGGDAEGED